MADFGNDLADFEAKVEQNIKLLSSKNVETRRGAVVWLGESGEPHVIEPLVKLYNREKDASVKKALTYSLGKFRALEEALDRGDDDKVIELLKRVTSEGKMGKRLGIPTAVLVVLMVVLLFSFVGLVGAFISTGGLELFTGEGSEEIEVTEVADNGVPSISLAEHSVALTGLLSRIRNNTNTLQAQYQTAVDGTFTDASCIAFFNDTQPYALSNSDSATYPALETMVGRLNTAIDDFNAAKGTLDTACLAAAPTLTGPEVADALQSVTALQSDLTSIELDLSELQASALVTPGEPTEEAVETEVVTEEPATPTFDPSVNPTFHYAPLSSLIDDMTTVRGPAVLLGQYWTDVSTSGTTGGCDQVDPVIPENYTIAQETAEASPELKNVVDAVNLGLQLLREGWRDFRSACANNNLNGGLSRGQIAVGAINNAFTSAENQLDALRSG